MNPAVQRFDETREPCLQSLSLSTFLGANPVRQLCDDYRARVAAFLFCLQPSDDLRVAMLLCRLADDVRVEQPVHNFRRFAGARRRGGTSSGLTGHSFMTVSQLSWPPSLRKTMASSSGSQRASKY